MKKDNLVTKCEVIVKLKQIIKETIYEEFTNNTFKIISIKAS